MSLYLFESIFLHSFILIIFSSSLTLIIVSLESPKNSSLIKICLHGFFIFQTVLESQSVEEFINPLKRKKNKYKPLIPIKIKGKRVPQNLI